MSSRLRVASLVCSLLHLSVACIWTYGLAIVGIPFGIVARVLVVRARRRELEGAPSSREAALGRFARSFNIGVFVVSLVSLALTR